MHADLLMFSRYVTIRNVWKYYGPLDQISVCSTNSVLPRALLLVLERKVCLEISRKLLIHLSTLSRLNMAIRCNDESV